MAALALASLLVVSSSAWAGVSFVTKWGTSGTGSTQFAAPFGVAFDPSSANVWVTERDNNRVNEFTSSGTFIQMFGKGVDMTNPGDRCTAASGDTCQAGTTGNAGGQFSGPFGAATDASGNLYVGDHSNHRVQKFDSSGTFVLMFGKGVDMSNPGDVCTAASGDTCQGGSCCAGTGSEFSGSIGLATLGGNVYSVGNEEARAQEFNSGGAFLSMWGWGVATGAAMFEKCTTSSTCHTGVAGAGAGQFHHAYGVGVDSAGNIYIGDRDNHRIQRFDSSHDFVAMWGQGVDATTGGDVCTAASGDTCQAGMSSGATDAVGAEAVAVDPSGNVFAADEDNNRVDEFTSSGAFVQMWGWGVQDGASKFEVCTSGCQAGLAGTGDGQFNINQGIAVDAHGNVIVADTGNNRVEEFNLGSATAGATTGGGSGGTGGTGGTALATPPGPVLGGLDLDGYCRAHGFVRSQVNGAVLGPGAASLWNCVKSTGQLVPLNLQDACNFQYPTQDSLAFVRDPNNANTWVCVAVDTGRLALDALYGPSAKFFFLPRSQAVQRLTSGGYGLQVTTQGSCNLQLTEGAGTARIGRASARTARKHRRRLIKTTTAIAAGQGVHLIPIVLTAKGKRLVRRLRRHADGGAVTAAVRNDPINVTCTPVQYPTIRDNGGTQMPNLSGSPTVTGSGTVQPGVLPVPPLAPKAPPAPKTITYTGTNSLGDSLSLTVPPGGKGSSMEGQTTLRCTNVAGAVLRKLAINAANLTVNVPGGFVFTTVSTLNPPEVQTVGGSVTAQGAFVTITDQQDPIGYACSTAAGAGQYSLTAQ